MATATHNREAVRTIRRKLNGLRRKLSTWIFVRGMSRWLLVVLGIFALDMLMDRFFKMDFAQRLIMLVLMLAVFVVYLFFKLIRPLSHKIGDEKLLMQVENQNSESGQSIISTYQLAQDDELEAKGISQELTDATIQQGMQNAKKIAFGSALDNGQAGKNMLLLAVGAAVTAVLGVGVWFGTQKMQEQKTNIPSDSTLVSNVVESSDVEVEGEAESVEEDSQGFVAGSAEFLGIWFNRNLLLGDAQWPQDTYLQIVGAKNGEVVVARGSAHQQVVMVSDRSRVKDVEVELEVDGPNGRTSYPMKLFGELKHRFVFNNVSSELRFRAIGGDAETEWVNMVLVEAPAVVNSTLEATWPKYTGLEPSQFQESGPHSLLPGSQVKISIETNKPLSECMLKIDDNYMPMASDNDESTAFTTTLGVDSPLLGGKYDFALKDQRGLKNNRPASFTLKLKEDKPPKVRAELVGISGLVVPRAVVPTRFSALDDYGLRAIEFDCGWKDDSSEQELINRKFPIFDVKKGEIELKHSGQEELALAPLNLQPGTGFRFVVTATDSNPDLPGVTDSREFLLRVVTEEELRNDLLRREIEQRKAFKQAYDAQLAAIAEIRGIAGMKQSEMSDEEFTAEQSRRLSGAFRGQKLIGTNVNAVRQRFDDFVVEVRNNDLDDPNSDPEKTLEYRFGTAIAGKIRDIDAGGMMIKNSEGENVVKPDFVSLAALNLENCRRSLSNRSELNAAVEQTTQTQEKILAIMREVLDAMEDSELFQSAINDLLEIKRIENEILEALNDDGKGEAPKGVFEK